MMLEIFVGIKFCGWVLSLRGYNRLTEDFLHQEDCEHHLLTQTQLGLPQQMHNLKQKHPLSMQKPKQNN